MNFISIGVLNAATSTIATVHVLRAQLISVVPVRSQPPYTMIMRKIVTCNPHVLDRSPMPHTHTPHATKRLSSATIDLCACGAVRDHVPPAPPAWHACALCVPAWARAEVPS